MKILDTRALDGPNIYHHKPVLVMRLDLEEVAETHSAMIPGFVDRLLERVPELTQHRCSPGYVGGFVERLRTGTYPAHIVEHVAIGLSERAGFDIGFGKARHSGEGTIYNVIIRYRSEAAMCHLFEQAVALVDATMRDRPFDVDRAVEGARRLAEEDEPRPAVQELVDAACARRIPVRREKGGTIRLGHGAFSVDVEESAASHMSLDTLFPPGTDGRIPIVAITGSHGTTGAAALVARILGGAGMGIGIASRDGITIDDAFERGDASDSDGARALLDDPRVDAAVLEVSWQGILRSGLGYDWSDVAVLTTASEEDLGAPGIEEIEDLTNVMSVVAERVREGGTIVLNADDPAIVALAASERIARIPRSIVMISVDPDSFVIAEHVAGGSTAVVPEEGWIVVKTSETREPIARISDLLDTLRGDYSDLLIMKALASVAAALALGYRVAA